ncbi:hypothetical protein MJM59_28390, partial [Salmonella enterica subsp. enterica serovar Montevideo]|nr:hypothetical protein [Salmonella enterica subsp. enterica serovar Montevideo]
SLPDVRRLFVGKKFSADSGKLPLISDSRFHHVTKPDSFASGADRDGLAPLHTLRIFLYSKIE